MKTPIQELIDRLKEEKNLFINSQGVRYETAMEFAEAKKRDLQSYEQGLHFETAIELAEAMLEREKDEIISAYIKSQYDTVWDVPSKKAKQYYNENFNTKEK